MEPDERGRCPSDAKLLAAAADFLTDLGVLGALALVGQEVDDCLVDSLLVRGDPEHGVGKLNGGNLLAVHIDDIKLCHCVFLLYAFTLSWMVTTEPFGPGIAPLIAIRLFSASTLTMLRFWTVTRTAPMWPGRRLPLTRGTAGSGTVRTGMTCNRAGAVALTQAVLAKALDNALIALALAGAGQRQPCRPLRRHQP